MKSKRPVFFTIGANCLDHKAPIIYKLATETNLPVDLVFLNSSQNRMEHLTEFLERFDSVNIYELDQFLAQRGGTDSNPGPASSRTQFASTLLDLGRRLPTNIPERVYESAKNRFSFSDPRSELITRQLSAYDDYVLIFDWDLTELGEEIITNLSNPVLSFPHGDRTFQNAVRQARILKEISPHVMVNGEREFERTSGDSHIYGETNVISTFDGPNDPDFYRFLYKYNSPEKNRRKNLNTAFVVPNEPAAVKFSTFVEEEKIEVTGSPRYNSEWLAILSDIAPTFDWRDAQEEGLNVVLFLRSFHYFISKDMLFNTINVITQFSDVNLVIKEHPTSAKLYNYEDDFEPKSNLRIVRNEVPSASLLDWGHLFLDVGSSIVYEAIQRDKPVLNLDYLHSNSLVYSERIPSVSLDSIDELIFSLASIIEDDNYRTYSERDRQCFVDTMIQPKGDALDNCVRLIISHL